MVATERPGRGSERCSVHSSRPSVARCDGCGRALCLACATPVRGVALGVECLQAALGPGAPVPDVPSAARTPPARAIVRVAFALAVVATMLPWSRFGAGSEPFGAWTRSPRWSMAVALAASIGFVVSLGLPRLPRVRAWDVVLTAAAAAILVGSVLSLLAPPDFTSPWLGPWVALAAGLAALAASVLSRSAGVREGAHV